MDSLLHKQLNELLSFLVKLHPQVLAYLVQFVGHETDRYQMRPLQDLLSVITSEQLETLVQHSVKSSTSPDVAPDLEARWQLPPDGLTSFGTTLKLHQLQQVLAALNPNQVITLFEVFTDDMSVASQLEMLQQLQLLLSELQPATLRTMNAELRTLSADEHHTYLEDMLALKPQHFHLYAAMRVLLHMPEQDMLGLQEVLPTLAPVQAIQLVGLMRLQPLDVLEIRNALVPFEAPPELAPSAAAAAGSGAPSQSLAASAAGLHGSMGLPGVHEAVGPSSTLVVGPGHILGIGDGAMSDDDDDDEEDVHRDSPVRIQIVEQPPLKCVYKRNLRPHPVIRMVGDDSGVPNLQLVVRLMRCDTLQDLPARLLTGATKQRVSVAKLAAFKRLKVTQTSNQAGETHFCLRFELRAVGDDDTYKVLDSVQSHPFLVVSHSSQLKLPTTEPPQVNEVIPHEGSTAGATRVVVLGNNFLNTPCIRVRFDALDVMPVVHGPKTLVCIAPKHMPGRVRITVSNDAESWSPSFATFEYKDNSELATCDSAAQDGSNRVYVPQPLDLGQDFSQLSRSAFGEATIDDFHLIVDNTVPSRPEPVAVSEPPAGSYAH